MNAKNQGNKIITYTVITLNDSMFESCMMVVGYLVSKGHKVTILSDQTLEKQVEDTSVFADAIAGSDLTIIFCHNRIDGYHIDFISMVKKIPNTYAVLVFPSAISNPSNADVPDNIIGLDQIIGAYGKLHKEKVDYLMCNLAL